MTLYVDIAEADARADELVDRVLAGEIVVFTENGEQYAIMRPIRSEERNS